VFAFDLIETKKGAFLNIEGRVFKLFNSILEKYLDLGPVKTGKVNIFLNPKPEAYLQSQDNALSAPNMLSPFIPMPYSMTTNYVMEVVYLTSTEGTIPNKMLHKSINLREVMNLKNADGGVSKGNPVNDSKLHYGTIKQLALFMVNKVKTANLFETADDVAENEPTPDFDPAQ